MASCDYFQWLGNWSIFSWITCNFILFHRATNLQVGHLSHFHCSRQHDCQFSQLRKVYCNFLFKAWLQTGITLETQSHFQWLETKYGYLSVFKNYYNHISALKLKQEWFMLIHLVNNFSITIAKNSGGFQWLKTYFCFVCHCFFHLVGRRNQASVILPHNAKNTCTQLALCMIVFHQNCMHNSN